MRFLMTLTALFALAPLAYGQGHGLFIFANDDQDSEQQEMDEFQCLRLARDRTGFDPMATPTATQARPETQGGGLVGGAARGALLGTAVGAVSGSSRSTAARRGAAAGGLIGSARRSDSQRQQDNWQREQQQNYQRNREQWTRAFSACMESRGYTVG